MKVHFICTGNTYRSRLAEAYLNSKRLKDVEVFSSGIEADKNLSGPISWYAARMLFNFQLINYMSNIWQKTTKDLLDEGDLTVFLEQEHFDHCKDNLGYADTNYEILGIEDVDYMSLIGGHKDHESITDTEDAFKKIRAKVDEIVEKRLS